MQTEDADVQLNRLVLAAVAGIVAFAFVDHLVARTDPGSFDGLLTKTDALYFTLTTLTTVGYGDVHPVSQLARQVVMAQLAFNVVVLAGAARTLTRGLAGRPGRGRPPAPRAGKTGTGSAVDLHPRQAPDHGHGERDEQE